MKQGRLQTRREFLKKGCTLAAISFTVPSFITRTVFALNNPFDVRGRAGRAAADDRIFVVVHLGGGNDALNTVVRYSLDEDYRRRPNLGIAKGEILRVNDEIGLHRGLKALKSIYDEGHLAVVQGVGY